MQGGLNQRIKQTFQKQSTESSVVDHARSFIAYGIQTPHWTSLLRGLENNGLGCDITYLLRLYSWIAYYVFVPIIQNNDFNSWVVTYITTLSIPAPCDSQWLHVRLLI